MSFGRKWTGHPPPHPSPPFLLPSHRLLWIFSEDMLGSGGVPLKKGCFDLCWTYKWPWSLGSCLSFLGKIMSLVPDGVWTKKTYTHTQKNAIPALLTVGCLASNMSLDSNTPYWRGSITSLNVGLSNWEWKHFSFEHFVLYKIPQGEGL